MKIRQRTADIGKYIVTGIAIACIMLIAGSCSTIAVSHFSQRKATERTRYVNQSNIIQMPLLVDLKIEDRLVSGSFSGQGVNEEYAKNMSVANAIRQAGADVLVEPFYDITVNDNTISVEVRGHPALYKNFRQPKSPEDKGSDVELRYVKPGVSKKTIK